VAIDEPKITCKTPTPGKKPTRIARWKYDLLRQAILSILSDDDQVVEFKQLAALVRDRLRADELERLGSVSWYTTTVKLDLEVKGEIERIAGTGPQKLRRR